MKVCQSNVIDLMAALRKSLGQAPVDTPMAAAKPAKGKAKAKEPVRNQPGLKLPIRGGKAADKITAPVAAEKPVAAPSKQARKRV